MMSHGGGAMSKILIAVDDPVSREVANRADRPVLIVK